MTKTVYLFDQQTGEFKGTYDAQESPLEPGVFIVPICSTESEPLAAMDGQSIRFVDGAWVYQALPVPQPELPPEPPTPEQLQREFTAAIQQRLDAFAQTRNYDGILSACTYATSTVAKFKAEGQYCVDARDATWSTCYAILGAVQAGTRPMPTLAEIEAELPVLEWPL